MGWPRRSCAAQWRLLHPRRSQSTRLRQLRRPTTLLPIAACSAWVPGTVLGRSDREVEPSLPALPWPPQASVIPLYYVTAVTSRAETCQFHNAVSRRRQPAFRHEPNLRPTRSSDRKPPVGHEKWQSTPDGSSCTSISKRDPPTRLESLARGPPVVCIVRFTRLMLSVHQPDPPGLIHDDPRLLPPWRGSSFISAHFVHWRRCPQPPLAPQAAWPGLAAQEARAHRGERDGTGGSPDAHRR